MPQPPRHSRSGALACLKEATPLGVICALLALCAATLAASAQGTRADYDRANNLRRLTSNKVFRDRVQPHWFADNTRFWYEVKTGPDTREFVVVDAEKGTRQSAFDHARLAEALQKAGLPDARADDLPLQSLEFDPTGHSFRFEAGGKGWRCGLPSYSLEESTLEQTSASGMAVENAPRASTRTGPETTVNFVNHTANVVEIFWLDPDGERRSYGKLRPDDERSQHTYAGHVWLVADDQGRPIAVFQAEENTTVADITGRPARNSRPRRGSSRRRVAGNDTSPDGQWRASVHENNIMIGNVKTGDAFALTRDGTGDDAYSGRIYWSPDSKLWSPSGPGKARTTRSISSSLHPKDQLQPKLDSMITSNPATAFPISRPHLFDVESKKEIPVDNALFPNPWTITDVRWAPDSKRFTFLYNQRGHQVLRILAVDARTRRLRPIVDETEQNLHRLLRQAFTPNTWTIRGRSSGCPSATAGITSTSMTRTPGAVKNQITQGHWVVREGGSSGRETRQIWFRAGRHSTRSRIPITFSIAG